jgi:diguanylate cyclase (GGDEF)-like protein
MPKARVLAVDDQRYFRELVESLLSEEGFETQVASSGEEALRILEHSHFDVVVTDLVMPGMDGCELVHRIKQRDPDQEVVVVTGVVDVRTAVEAMKLGATDYLLKPFDRSTLTRTLEGILQARRLKGEHARLLAENIEYLGERSLFERALRLFGRLSVPPLAEEIVEGLCIETDAQRGVIWTASADGRKLELAAARGLVRVDEEPEALGPEDVPEALTQGRARVAPARDSIAGAAGLELLVVLRQEGRPIALVRLGDKLGGAAFDPVDSHCAERFASFAERALGNAMRFRALERRTLQDPATGAYIYPYFEDAARNEIEKANRFGRSVSLLALDLGRVDELRREWGEGRLDAWLGGVAGALREPLRTTDLLATDGGQRFWALLPEADALGAAQLKERARETLEAGELFAGIDPAWGVRPELASATFPGDGTQLESLVRCLDERLAEAAQGRSRIRRLAQMPLAESLRTLLQEARSGRAETACQITRFVLEEVARRPGERRLLFLAPGEALAPTVAEGLGVLRRAQSAAEIAVVAAGERPSYADADVAWIAPERVPALPPFLVHYGDGPPYALVSEEGAGGRARLFHTGDRSLVEHLALRLQRELGIRSPVEPRPREARA